MRTKNRQINFRVTEKEYQALDIQRARTNMTFSDYLLYSALAKEIIIIEGLAEFISELRRIGANLNQLTKLCHEGRISCVDLSEVKDVMSNIWKVLSFAMDGTRK